ncbi:hypothetical protein BGX28_005049 [Mortierella sp. GBA30]|nr:hypothetical protein BGX28_005049 [Mortierella sp. GBA30]
MTGDSARRKYERRSGHHRECETTPTIPGDPTQMRLPSPHCPYTEELNKATVDIVRYAGAHAFLRLPVSRPDERHSLSNNTPIPFEFNDTAVGESMLACYWRGLEQVFQCHRTALIRDRATSDLPCFKRYEHTVKAIAARGIPQYRFGEVVDGLIKVVMVQNKDVEELREAMFILECSDDVTWKGQTVSYTSDNGFYRLFHFYKYVNQTTDNVDIAFGSLAADFTIVPDLLIVDKKKVGWFELDHEENHRNPRRASYHYSQRHFLLNTYSEVAAYRQMAATLRQHVPEYPSLANVCIIV